MILREEFSRVNVKPIFEDSYVSSKLSYVKVYVCDGKVENNVRGKLGLGLKE